MKQTNKEQTSVFLPVPSLMISRGLSAIAWNDAAMSREVSLLSEVLVPFLVCPLESTSAGKGNANLHDESTCKRLS